MFRILTWSSVLLFAFSSCQTPEVRNDARIKDLISLLPSIEGNSEYLETPFVTAGDRVYLVGHQDGSFPDLGWHVEGEMGGIWDHPVKLMDGFQVEISIPSQDLSWCLPKAARFVNFPLANAHYYPEINGVQVERWQFVPDRLEGVIVQFSLTNNTTETINLEFTFIGQVDLSPVWLAEQKNIQDGHDEVTWQDDRQVLVARDAINDWFAVFGSDLIPKARSTEEVNCSNPRKGNGADASLTYALRIEPLGETTIPIFVAGSYQSKEQALETHDRLAKNVPELLRQKMERYRLITETSDIQLPDPEIQEMYTWVKYNTDWLMRNVPEVGYGLSAGIPDYPWWFGVDNCYSLQGVYAIGRPAWAKSTIELLHRLSTATNNNGRIVHEASTNGVVFNPGNLNETPHFAVLIGKMYDWTGDIELLREVFPNIKKGLEWISTEMDQDQNMYPDGEGIMEIHGLSSEMIDVVVYTQQAFKEAAKMANALGESRLATEYSARAAILREKINSEWWVPEFQSYADFIATTGKTLRLIDDAIIRADSINKPWAREELERIKTRLGTMPIDLKKGQVVHHNWIVNTPMEMGVADPEKAILALETGSKYTNRFGMYVTGIDRDENISETTKWKSFSYVGAVMTLGTGVQAIGESNYGNPDGALGYLKMLHNSFSYALPGSMYEVSPDYGMIAQAWNVYAVAVPIVTQFFGIKPRAYEQTVRIEPRMPSAWQTARINQVPVGNNMISVEKTRHQQRVHCTIIQKIENWTIEFSPEPGAQSITINDQPVESTDPFVLTGFVNEIAYSIDPGR